MGKDYGEAIEYDPDFNGPTHNRSCTDVIWLVVFVIFLGGWGYIGYYSMTTGDVQKVLAPMDSKGRRCGLDSGLENKRYLLFFNIARCLSPGTPIVGCPTPQVCVERCPDRTILFDRDMTESSFAQFRSNMVCTDEVNTQTMTYNEARQHIEREKCASFILQSEPVLFRCIGDLSALHCKDTSEPKIDNSGQTCVRKPEAQKFLKKLNTLTVLESYVGWVAAKWVSFFAKDERDSHILSERIVRDLVQSRWYMLGALVAVVIICFIYILLLRWVVGPVVWTSIVGLFAVLGFSIYLCYTNYAYYKANPVTMQPTTNFVGYTQSIFTQKEAWMVLLVILAVVTLILLLIVVFLRSRIVVAIALIREGSKAVMANKSTVTPPIFSWLIQCIVITYGVLILVLLMSIGDPAFKVVNLSNDTTCNCNGLYTENYVSCDPKVFTENCRDTVTLQPCHQASCHMTGIESPQIVTYLHILNLLGFFWMTFFVSGVADMMLASTFSTWYWTFDKRDLPFFSLTSGICRTLRYHLGTVAFGALIIAIVRVIRVILEYIDHKLKKFDNPFTRCVLCLCKCFCWCLENFLKFINKNAYIMCAVHGKNFCSSARDAFSLLMRNIVRVLVLDKVTDFIFFLSKVLISIAIGIAVYYILQVNYVYEITKGERLNYNYVPAVILSVATYLICTIFFNVYTMAVDTLFLCFLEDCERNDGSPEKPYFMSKNLMKILGKKNKTD